MAQTAIEWTWRRHPDTGILHPGYTLNYWIGCTKVSEACAHCYAATLDERKFARMFSGGTPEAPVTHWGQGAPRYRTKSWKDAYAWNRKAKREGIALAVFCFSLSDWADEEVPDTWRDDFFADVVLKCPNLDFLLLTKRTQKAREYLNARGCPPNVWVGASMENQKRFDERIHDLLAINGAAGYFASCEPLLGPIDITAGLRFPPLGFGGGHVCVECQTHGLDWVIVGGESNGQTPQEWRKSRPMHPDDALAIGAQCWAANVAFTFKQWGDWAPAYELDHDPQAQGQAIIGNVPSLEFPTGEEGRRLTFCFGKHRAGRKLEGIEWAEHPTTRRLAALTAG